MAICSFKDCVLLHFAALQYNSFIDMETVTLLNRSRVKHLLYTSQPCRAVRIIIKSKFFRWVQKIFQIGYKRTLTEEDVFPIDPRLKSERLTALLEQSVV